MPTSNPVKSGMVAVMHFFGMKIGDFRAQWERLTDDEKKQLKDGIGDYNIETGKATGSLTY